jgi:cytochrome c oxidase subunit III
MTSKPLYPVPRRASTVGILLFLVSLSILFAASLLGYFWIRLTGDNSPRGRVLHLPMILWLSTAVMIGSSFTITLALRAIRTEQQQVFRRYLLYTVALAITFVAIQAPAMVQMLRQHFALAEGGMRLWGVIFFLVLLHALHVLGGLIALAILLSGARRGAYDHEHHIPVRNAVLYWHFLDIVWLVMFFSMTVVG